MRIGEAFYLIDLHDMKHKNFTKTNIMATLKKEYHPPLIGVTLLYGASLFMTGSNHGGVLGLSMGESPTGESLANETAAWDSFWD